MRTTRFWPARKRVQGVDEILERVIERIPAPGGDPAEPLQALVIDSWFDNYVGVVMLVRMVNGSLKPKDKLLLMSPGRPICASRSASSRPRPSHATC